MSPRSLTENYRKIGIKKIDIEYGAGSVALSQRRGNRAHENWRDYTA